MNRARVLSWLSPFACGAVVALVVIVSRQDLSAAKIIMVPTCTAADGTLRLADAGVPCAPEERRIRIKVRIPDDPECKEDNQRLQRLESRLKDLEYRKRMGTLSGRKVRAPFQVVTKEKKQRLLRIEEQNVTFYNHDQKPVVWIQTDDSGGMLHAQTAAGDREVMLRAQGRRSHLLIKEKGNDRVDLGRRANGGYSLQVYGPQNSVVAGIGQSRIGTGILAIGDAAGVDKVRISIDATSGLGSMLVVANAAGTVVGSMSAAAGGGTLVLTDSGGNSMVEAGLTDGVGVVRTLPGKCHFGIGILGLVPNCIIGKQ